MVLDDTVKRKINNARDILVGKVPDPKAQIEQITIALIYKFMDDMDKKLGDRIYFKGELKDYSWDAILNEKDSATFFEKYVKAIDLFQRAEHFPKFFQEVFKNAYVPYKDSRTLKLFLTEMSYFDYEHSEKLGDAFEYLLSVMGSQGDAGQFRTPRHIIDFIADIFEPEIGEKILDPACGTAGFLISAVKNIEKRHGKLGRIELNKIRDNLFGFDISPDMVRLALVNMFLHGFSDPKIEEFDTLSSDKRWTDRYDLILANPPFMTPKGGITPHDLLLTACDSTRAEVLFTHYILTHLKEQGEKKGRAGIIVPEGIIFQSGKAYKKLREELVKKGLFSVVSLPSGVFNPYSGVKTSILLIDKNIISDNILFVKINGDGLDLGAQRRENGKNDLPQALEIIKKYRKTQHFEENELSHLVSKEKIAETNEYNLSGDRYKETQIHSGNYPMIELGEICDIFNGSTPSKSEENYWNKKEINWFTVEDIRIQGRIITTTNQYITKKALEETSVKLLPKNTILLCCTASIGEYALSKIELTTNQQFNGLVIKEKFKEQILPEYLFYQASKFSPELNRLGGTTSFKFVSIKNVKTIKIPLPLIEIQKKIVEEIESYQKIIDGAKLVVDNYKPKIEIDKDWEIVELGEITKTSSGGTPLKSKKEYWENPSIPWLRSGEVAQGEIFDAKIKISKLALKESSTKIFPIDSVLVAMYGATVGNVGILKFESTTNQAVCAVLPNYEKFIPKFLFYILKQKKDYLISLGVGGAQPNISQQIIKSLKIPLPSLEIQKQIVKEIENEQKLVESNKELIKIFEKKIEDVIIKVWQE